MDSDTDKICPDCKVEMTVLWSCGNRYLQCLKCNKTIPYPITIDERKDWG